VCAQCRRELLDRAHITAHSDAAREECGAPVDVTAEHRRERLSLGDDLDSRRTIALARNKADFSIARPQCPDAAALTANGQPYPV
jgi:hypothetical protein